MSYKEMSDFYAHHLPGGNVGPEKEKVKEAEELNQSMQLQEEAHLQSLRDEKDEEEDLEV